MLTLNLIQLFKARGIERPYTFLVKAGFSAHTATTIIHNSTKVFRLKHIELLCEKLNCTPNDILVWTPEKNKKLNDNHPLTKLKKNDTNFDIHETLKTIPLEQLKEIASIIKQNSKPTTT